MHVTLCLVAGKQGHAASGEGHLVFREQHAASWDHYSMAGAETLSLLSFLNHPACSLTAILLLSASAHVVLGTTYQHQNSDLLLCIHLLSRCRGSFQAVHQPEIAQPGKGHLLPALLFAGHPFYPNLPPEEIPILWCGQSCTLSQVITA